MTIANPMKFKGFKGEAVRIKMTETSKGLHYQGPGSWVGDRLSINGNSGMVIAEREIKGNNGEKIVVTITLKISDDQAKDLINEILKPYRNPFETINIYSTDLEIWDSEDKRYSILGGNISEILRKLNLDLDHPFPDGTELKVIKY